MALLDQAFAVFLMRLRDSDPSRTLENLTIDLPERIQRRRVIKCRPVFLLLKKSRKYEEKCRENGRHSQMLKKSKKATLFKCLK